MARITKLDQALLAEAYTTQLFQESAPYMTIAEIQKRLPYMTLEEAQIIEEILGQIAAGIGGVAGAAGRGLAAAGRGVASAVGKKVGQAAGAVAQKAQQIGTGAQKLGSGVKAAAGQVAQNVGNLYSTAAGDKAQSEAIEKASKSAMDLIDLIQAAQNNGLINLRGEVTNMSLAQIMNRLEQAKGQTETQKQAAQQAGLGGGVKNAFKQGMQSAGSQSTGAQQPPPLPAGAQATA
jgi:hypothetical protein